MSTVMYHRVFNLGNYENERIGFELPIEPGESHADALARVKALVMDLGGKGQEFRRAENRRQKAEYELYSLQNKLNTIQREVTAAIKKHDDLRTILEKHGVTLEPLDDWYRQKAEVDADQPDEDSDDQDWEEDDED